MNVTFQSLCEKLSHQSSSTIAREAEVAREVAHAPRHHADFRLRQPAQRRLVKMVEVRVRQQHQVNRRQIADVQAGALEPLQEEQPVRKVRVHQHVQVVELDEKRRVADPRHGHLAVPEPGEKWPADACPCAA